MKTVEQIEQNMLQAIGTTKYIKHFTGALVFTDGVEQLREDADCYWLVDAIASYRRTEPFQVWELVVNADKSAVLTMKEDSGRKPKVTQKIGYTDFPLEKIELWVEEGYVGDSPCMVLLLPSEH